MPDKLPKHKPARPFGNDPLREQTNARRRARYLPANGARWRKIRAAQLQAEPLCRMCLHPANEVDHIEGDTRKNRLMLDLQSMCKPCHSAKTWRESLKSPATTAPRIALSPRNTRAHMHNV